MKNDLVEELRKVWNAEHAVLRLLLEKADTPKAIQLFLKHHATAHSAQLFAGKGGSFQDEVLSGFTKNQIRHQLPGHQKIMPGDFQ